MAGPVRAAAGRRRPGTRLPLRPFPGGAAQAGRRLRRGGDARLAYARRRRPLLGTARVDVVPRTPGADSGAPGRRGDQRGGGDELAHRQPAPDAGEFLSTRGRAHRADDREARLPERPLRGRVAGAVSRPRSRARPDRDRTPRRRGVPEDGRRARRHRARGSADRDHPAPGDPVPDGAGPRRGGHHGSRPPRRLPPSAGTSRTRSATSNSTCTAPARISRRGAVTST